MVPETEVLSAWRAGASVVKLFPAGPVGAGYLKDLRGPLADIPPGWVVFVPPDRWCRSFLAQPTG